MMLGERILLKYSVLELISALFRAWNFSLLLHDDFLSLSETFCNQKGRKRSTWGQRGVNVSSFKVKVELLPLLFQANQKQAK